MTAFDFNELKNELSIAKSNGVNIAVSLDTLDKNISSVTADDGKLVMKYNNGKGTLTADLSKYDCYADGLAFNTDTNVLSVRNSNKNVANDLTACLSSLDRYNVSASVDESNILKIADNFDNVVSAALPIHDTYISSAVVIDNSLVLAYNDDNLPKLSTSLSKYDCYADGLAFNTDTNVLSVRNSNKNVANDLTACLSSLDRYNVSASIDSNNVLKITDNASSEVSVKLPMHDTYISAIGIDENSDTMTFDYNVADISAKSVNLRTYRQNDWIESGLYDTDSKQLVLKYHKDEKFDICPSDVSIEL